MTISSLADAARIACRPGDFYAKGISGQSRTPAATGSAPGQSTVVSISEEARSLLAARQVSETDVQSLQALLARAQQSGAAGDPKAFLGSLSREELGVLQRAQCLAEPIDVSSLSYEGAANLLVEPGKAQDLDNNGLTQVGEANLMVFPPQNAPESFKAAWKKASEGMSPLDLPGHMVLKVGIANIRRDPVSGMSYSLQPGDPGWVNPYADPNFDYRKEVGAIMDGLSYEVEHAMISRNQFEKDMGFYRRLTEAMGS